MHSCCDGSFSVNIFIFTLFSVYTALRHKLAWKHLRGVKILSYLWISGNQSNFSAAFQLVTRWLSFHLKFIVVYFICKSMVCNHVSPWNCKLCIPLFKLVHADLGQGRKGSHLQIMKGLQWFSIVLRRNLYANAAEGSNSFHISLLHCPPFSKFGIFPIRSWS